MKSILSSQSELQSRYAQLRHYNTIDPSNPDEYLVDEVYEYIQKMQFFINEEINELLLELGEGNRSIHKPWSTMYRQLRDKRYKPTDETKNEAIDAFCFMMNIMLISGITPENIDQQYRKVFDKNINRQNNSSY